MKKNVFFQYITLAFFITGYCSCSNFLDQVPNDRQTIEEVFQKKRPSEEYLANIYNFVPDESDQWNGHPWTGNVDEINVAWAKWTIYQLNVGNWSAGTSPFYKWQHYYNGIRSATYFMNHIDGNKEILSLDGQSLIDQYKAEARFLRAFFYFMNLRQYGPVVLIGDKELPADASAADLQLPRSSFDECVEYIVSELDQAAAVLPVTPATDRDYGRATRGAALALKSRLLLYAASPEFNGNKDFASFLNIDGTPFISQTVDREKWKRAADAAKAVIDLNEYHLYEDPSGDPVKSYRGIHLTPWNNECIFVRKSNDLWNWDYNCSLRSAGGWNGISPVQEMVDSYFMRDGKPISQSDLYSETGFTNGVYNMYVNREPRFYASVLYNGAQYKGGAITQNPITVDLTYSGRDGKKNGGEDYSHTGYLVLKNVSPETNRLANISNSRPYVLIRLGEIYLNYAEALAEYGGNDAEAMKYLNLIRKRAGIPEYGSPGLPPVSGATLIQKIRDERRIELAFESHRWFDVRRWKIVKSVMGNLHGMNVDGDGDEFYRRVVADNHIWKEAYYWFPLSQYEMDRGHQLVQNPGW
ncbi:RagB/SusD family nutrient uptake outer membrane protein [Pararcticibacter amylolyticus]|uniref:RagB/SusD family nutrient uptake outer membrane protein n=1 Tax=Pararcticibacter amylolyticus TaxID=2173175 RepID=A0A2U2PHR9_9SPHI|nr:RagB/SusD family nutrient uptake outer membrane protein [Pararcticibacter amylolyticus]PWG80958.1 RagB/SusD family nutrient uptake outer membrane protein [Pararcticibacter amylolyticus]